MKISFYSSSQKEEKRKKEAEKVGFYNMNLYFTGINNFCQFHQLHKTQTPSLALPREKTTDKEKDKKTYNTIADISSRRGKKDRKRDFYWKKRIKEFSVLGF